MFSDIETPARIAALLELGEDATLRAAPDGWRDYIVEFELTPDDSPALIAVLKRWVDVVEDEPDDEAELQPQWCAPIHAWRALGQLRALDAVEPMLAQLDWLDEALDDWSNEDWPDVWEMIGPPALPALLAFAGDGAHREFARVQALRGAAKIAQGLPEHRDAVVQTLTLQLARYERAPIVNAVIAGQLVDLRAIESAEVIERAFAADVIDESYNGCWGDLRKELGVEGLGLAPLTPRRGWFDEARLSFVRRKEIAHSRERKAAKREKAKRKAATKARKRNRRAK